MRVSEDFYSIQGEGVTTGVPSLFLRLQGCNLMCGGQGTEKDKKLHNNASWRCDTIEVWLKGQNKTPRELRSEWQNKGWYKQLLNGGHLVITGGEPLLQQKEITQLLMDLPEIYTEIETNGTIKPDDDLDALVNQYNVSPKLTNSGMPANRRINGSVIDSFAKNDKAYFKFVVNSEKDVVEALQTYIIPSKINRERVYLMPGCSTREQLIKESPKIAELSKKYGLQNSTRLQLLIWDKATGV